MPRDHMPVGFGNLAGGINQFLGDQNASPDQCADALDVIVTDGDVRRREALRSVSAGPVHLLPTAQTVIGAGAFILVSGRRFAYSSSGPWYIGCLNQFDGFDWGDITANSAGTPTSHKRLLVEYWNGSAWTAIPFVLDTTIHYRTGETYSESLGRNGQVHWHRDQLTGWANTHTQGGLTGYYWVRITVVAMGTTTPTVSQQQWAQSAPGVRCFLREALSSVLPLNIANRAVVMLGTDRTPRRGLEAGANLGVWDLSGKPVRALNLTKRFAAGLFGTLTFPDALGPGDVPSITASQGTANSITDQCDLTTPANQPERFSYLREQPFGSAIVNGISPFIGTPTTVSFQSTTAILTTFFTNDFEGYLIRVTTGGGGGPAANETRQISSFTVSGGVATIQVGDQVSGAGGFSAAPVAGTVFEILRPPNFVYAYPADREYPIATECTDGRTLLLETSNTEYPNPNTIMSSGQALHFEIRQPLRFAVPSGDQWTAMTDRLSGSAILANGSALLEYNGRWLRELTADSDSALALEVSGTLPAVGPDGFSQDQGYNPTAKLRTAPPPGKWVLDYSGRIVVGGGEPNTVFWSMPHGANRIWPWSNAATVRDQLGQSLSGLHVLYDRLYAFTPSSIHEGTLTDDGGITFRPVSIGLGFSSHAGVQAVPLGQSDILLGPSSDGIYAFAGGEPTPILDQWERVVPGGVNLVRLNKSVSCTLRQQGLYLLAVTPKGSDSNTRIIVWDYQNKAFWLWSAPFGVASMASFVDATGAEFLLLGTEDGFLCTLMGADTDDGETVTGRIRTRSAQPLPGKLANIRRICTTGRALGSGQTVSYSLFLEESRQPRLTGAFPEEIGNATYGTAVYGTGEYAQQAMKTHAVHIPNGTRGQQIQVELSCSTWGWRFRRLWVEMIPLSSGRV